MFGSLRYNIGTARNSNGPVPFAWIKRKQGNFKPEIPFQNNTGLPWTASQQSDRSHSVFLKAAVLRNILKYHEFHFFKISLQIYNSCKKYKKTLHIFTFLLWKQTNRFSAIGIFLLYITATALVTQLIMQRKMMFYQRFFNWIKGSVIIDFSGGQLL